MEIPPTDILAKKKIDFQIEKEQIARILPEIKVLLKKVETSKSQVKDYIKNKVDFHPSPIQKQTKKIGGAKYIIYVQKTQDMIEKAPKYWSQLVENLNKTNDYMRYLISKRIFNIQHERKEIIEKTFILEIDDLVRKMPRTDEEAFKRLEKLETVLDEIKVFFKSFIENYTYVLYSKIA